MVWYVSPEEQLARLMRANSDRRLGFTRADFPPVPTNLPAMSENEFLLLVFLLPDFGGQSGLRRTFEAAWSAILPSGQLSKRRDEPRRRSLQVVPGQNESVPGIRWVVFNPSALQGLPSKDALTLRLPDRTCLAGVEVLVAAMLLPEWIDSFGGLIVLMSGIQQLWHDIGLWNLIPCLRVEGGAHTGQGLLLFSRVDNAPSRVIVSPTVREFD